MKYCVTLFQPYLRQFVLNFGKTLRQGEFINVASTPTRTLYKIIPTYEKEVKRVKTKGWRYVLRQTLGIPNVRFRYETTGDLLFTYGTLLITNKPYCPYLETGLSFFSYDLGISQNPIARFIVIFLTTRRNCHKLLFLSEAAKKSFFSTLHFSPRVRDILLKKSVVVYPVPLVETTTHPVKTSSGELKLLFVGLYYMKGGVELVHAFQKLRQTYSHVTLTMVTPFRPIKQEDLEMLRHVSGLNLLDATLNAEEMRTLYRDHHIFCLPTYRDGFGLVLIEALAYGMPLIITDQYATPEMLLENQNGFMFRNHPLQDYHPKTYEIFGKYYNPKTFYTDLFRFQREGRFTPVEDFLVYSIEQFLNHPSLLEEYSRTSLNLYSEKFHPEKIGQQLESIFLEALRR